MKVLILKDKDTVLCLKSLFSGIDSGIKINALNSVTDEVEWVTRYSYPNLTKIVIKALKKIYRACGEFVLKAFKTNYIDYLFILVENKNLAWPDNKNNPFTESSKHIKQPASLSFLN